MVAAHQAEFSAQLAESFAIRTNRIHVERPSHGEQSSDASNKFRHDRPCDHLGTVVGELAMLKMLPASADACTI
jgi:hypothetical protein